MRESIKTSRAYLHTNNCQNVCSLFQEGGKIHIKILNSNLILILAGYSLFAKNERRRDVTWLQYFLFAHLHGLTAHAED